MPAAPLRAVGNLPAPLQEIGGAEGAAKQIFDRVWKSAISKGTKQRIFKATVETMLLYGSDSWFLNVSLTKKLDGAYNKMLRAVYSVSLRDHITNKSLYGGLPAISDVIKRRRLALARHIPLRPLLPA